MDLSDSLKRVKRRVKEKFRGRDPAPNQALPPSTLTAAASGNALVSTASSASPLIQSVGNTTNLTNVPASTPILPSITLPPGATSVSAAGPTSTPVISTGAANPANTASTSASPQPSRAKNTAWSGLKTFLILLNASADAFGPLKSAVGGLVKCIDIYESAAQGRKDYEALRTELDSLFDTLVKRFDGPMPPQMTASIASLSNGIQKEVDLVHQKCNRDTLERLTEAIEDQQDVLNCYRRIQRLLSQISMNANLEMWRILDMQLAETRLRGMKISEAARYNSSESTGLLRGKCTPNTRRAIIGGLHTWVDDPDHVNVYWLNGMAGTGKTTIAYSFCAEREEIQSLGASFFCSRTSASCNDATLIVPTIAYQLALFSYPFRYVLCKLLGDELDICNRDVATQFRRMVVDTLARTRDSVPQNTVVVIDALDECSNQHDVGILLEALLQHASQLPIRFFVSSRAEGAIHPQMTRNPTLRSVFYLHEVEESFVREDIEIYVKTELDPISPSPIQISQLVQQAGRLFIYAATVIRYVRRDEFDGYSLDRLDSLLKLDENNDDIDNLYTRILTSAFNKPRLSKQEHLDMLEALHTVICAKEPLTVDALGALLRPKRPKVVRTALLPFYSVLHVSQINDLVTVLHASFPDYLFSQQRAGRFYCDMHLQNGQLARLCFNRINSVNPPFNICSLESSYLLDSEVVGFQERVTKAIPPELFYACRHWLAHVEVGDGPEELSPLVGNFLSTYLLLWMEVMNLKNCMSVGAQLLSRTEKWCQKHANSHILLELAQDAHNFATMFASSPASLSTPHIYVSMLALWSPDAPVSAHYRKCVEGLVEASSGALASGNSPLLARWPAGHMVNDLAISPDSTCFAIAHDYAISIWDVYTGKEALESIQGRNGRILSISYSPDGTRIVSGSSQGHVCVWDAHIGQAVLGPLEGHTREAISVAYSPDGARIMSGSYDKTIRVWDSSTGRIILVLEGAVDDVRSVAYSPDGATVAAGYADGTIFIWNLQTGRLTHSPLAHHNSGMAIDSVVYSPDGAHIASAANDTVFIRDVNTGENVHPPLIHGGFEVRLGVAYSPDGGRICTCRRDNGAIYIWDAHSGEKLAGPLFGHADARPRPVLRYPLHIISAPPSGFVFQAIPLDFNAAAKYLPDGSRILSTFSGDSSICIWDARTGEEWNSPNEGRTDNVSSVSFSPDGIQIISGSDNGTVCVWDARTGHRILGPLKGHDYGVITVIPSPDDSRIFSVSYDGTLFTWDGRTGKNDFEPVDGFSNIQAVACSPDGSPLIISGYRGPTIRIWDARSREMVLEMSENRFESVDLIACSPDGANIASSCYRTIYVWDISRRNIARTLWEHSDLIQSIAYSPDGQYIASSSSTAVFIWDARNGQVAIGPIEGHAALVDKVVYSPDGLHIASGSQDGTIHVWDARNGNMVAGPFCAPGAPIKSIAYSPDGARIAAASDDGVIRVWYPDRLNQGIDLSKEGWVLNSLSERLVWVPPDRQSNFIVGGEVRINTSNSFTVNFDGARLGSSWVDIYVSS